MTEGVKFEIIVDSKIRTFRDSKEAALEAARYLKTSGNNDVKVRNLATGEVMAI